MRAESVTTLALLLHEFATNAAKYGALSNHMGRIDIDCSEDGEQVTVSWKEAGGPPVSPTQEQGFGSVLAAATVRGQLAGDLTREWRPEGLFIRLTLPRGKL